MTNIRVALRVRPLSQREIEGNYPVVVAVENNSAFITDIRVPERPSADSRQRFRQFDFDHTFWFSNNGLGIAASQQQVYSEMGPHLEKAILSGYNACLLAYGQSGTGKTHTMLGTKDDPGIIPKLCHTLWEKLNVTYPLENGKPTFRMEVSFLEIYREKVRDLLDPEKSLKLREHPQFGPHVQGLTRMEVTGEISLLDLLWEGERRRASGNTSSNRRSSRSHAIWTLYLTVHSPTSSPSSSHPHLSYGKSKSYHCSRDGSQSKSSTSGESTTGSVITNQVHLVDLAGRMSHTTCEKADCTTAKSLLAEGADINRSLVALGNVISALAEKAQYVPYRDSTLTWLLKDSIGGNASTSIIITASPSSHCHAQTLNSLRFAQRARLVENTPKINLAPVSPSYYGPYGYLSVMSAMELKKDISRLAKIIKTAQTNGGILRGLAPKTGWTRLIHAIEGISHAEKEQVRIQRERAGSEDTVASSSQAGTSSSSTITAAKSLNDVMVQADIEKQKRNPLRRLSTRQSESSLATSTLPKSPTKIVGTEVFIPTSSSYKCLTWQQEESHPVPKPSSSASSLSEEPEDESSTPLTKCSSTPQIHHMKYLLQVHYPITHNVDHASRISEKIHGSISDEKYQTLIPIEVEDPFRSGGPLVQEKIPTLVNSSNVEEVSEQVTPVKLGDILNAKLMQEKSVMVSCVGKEHKDYVFPTRCKEFASALSPLMLSRFESSDENEFDDPDQIDLNKSIYHAVHPNVSKNLQRNLSGKGDECTFDDTCYFTAGESVLSQMPTMLVSSPDSSSYESIAMPESVRPVNLIREFSKTSDFHEDDTEDLIIDNEVFLDDFQPPVANICMVPGYPMDSAIPIEILVEEPCSLDNTAYFNPVNGVSDSKFRNYFAKELHQMERMGKQIKSLLQMTQRYNVVKPFLDEISNLQNSDHSKPDPKLDAHIESCSGWDVDVELAKVNKEIHSLNKVLKTGFGSGNGTSNINCGGVGAVKYPMSKGSTSTSNEGGVTSDSSIEVEGFRSSSYAHTRHIPLLSSGSKMSGKGEVPLGCSSAFKKSHPNQVTAKTSVSQPILSSSSNNGSVSSNVPPSMGEYHFSPNFYSTPERKPWGGIVEDDEEDFQTLHHPTQHRHQMQFRPHPVTTTSAQSMETFYRNPSISHAHGASGRLQYCQSNSNMSSVSSNISTSVNYDTANSSSYPESGVGYPLNISVSEPRRISELLGGHQAHKGYIRSSESSSSFQHNHPHHNGFNPEEIRSHRRIYEAGSSTRGGTSSRLSSVTKDTTDSWLAGNGTKGLNFQRMGAGEPSELQGYHQFHPQSHSRSASDSLDLCSCEKYGSSMQGGPLEKSSSHSRFSSFGGSTTTETSEYSARSQNNPYHPSHLPRQHLKSHGGNLNFHRMPHTHTTNVPQHHKYKLPVINRNDNF